MRLELKAGINNCTVINDSYNSDLGSLEIALDFLNQQSRNKKKTVILSDIFQSGKDEKRLYKEVSNLIDRKGVDRIMGIGEDISHQAEQFSTGGSFYESTEDFLTKYSGSLFHDEVILIKGARPFKFEEITKVLQQKTHETMLEVNLEAIVYNLNVFRSLLKPETQIMAMVKAFSYGSGSYEIANVLQFHRVDYLAVAYADEGVELRNSGITIPIMVMNPEDQSYDSMLMYNLEPEIYNFHVLQLFAEALAANASASSGPVPIHIKLETGMHRLGFEEDELDGLIAKISEIDSIYVQSVFSHLAASEQTEHDDFSLEQIEQFKKMSEKIVSKFDYPIMRHILNSRGIMRFEDAQFEMVRLGIGIYGIDDYGSSNEKGGTLHNVSTLKSSISQIKKVQSKDTIGYGRHGVVDKDMTIAIVPIGYADGLNRKLGNGRGKLLIKGKFAPTIGDICMDMCMVDITEIDVQEGDEVIVFGENYSVTEFAKDLETIPYEVLTSISRRVKRVYYHE
jgi:alanine racemase